MVDRGIAESIVEFQRDEDAVPSTPMKRLCVRSIRRQRKRPDGRKQPNAPPDEARFLAALYPQLPEKPPQPSSVRSTSNPPSYSKICITPRSVQRSTASGTRSRPLARDYTQRHTIATHADWWRAVTRLEGPCCRRALFRERLPLHLEPDPVLISNSAGYPGQLRLRLSLLLAADEGTLAGR